MTPAAAAVLPSAHPAPAPLWRHPALLLAVGLFVLRTLYLPWCELIPEEAYYWNYAQHLDIGYLDHPPMIAWLIWLGTTVFGHGEWGVRVGALLCSLATSLFTYRLTATLFRNRQAAVAAVGLVQCLPYFFITGWIMTPDAPLTACWAAMLYFLARVFFDGHGRAWWGVGLSLGLGMLSKYTIALLGPATLLFMVLDPAARGWFRRVAPYAAVGLAAVLFSPVVLWNARHHWASFAFQSVGRIKAASHFSSPALLGTILAVLTPPGVLLVAWVLARRRAPLDEDGRRVLFARMYTLVPLSVFVLFSLTHHVKLNWTGPLWLAAIPAVAALLTVSPAGWLRRSWDGVVAILCACYLVLLQYLATGLPGLRYFQPTELLPVGWKQLALELETRKNELRQAGAPDPVFVVGMDRDFIASEVAFYSPDPVRAVRETTGAHLFDGDSLMYAFWFPPPLEDGGTMLLVAFEKKELETARIARHSAAPGPVEEHLLQLDGKPVRPYYTRVVFGYHSERSSP